MDSKEQDAPPTDSNVSPQPPSVGSNVPTQPPPFGFDVSTQPQLLGFNVPPQPPSVGFNAPTQQPPIGFNVPTQPPPVGFNVPTQPPPAYDASQMNNQYPPQHFVQHMISSPFMGPNPCSLVCPFCHQHVVTKIYYQTSIKTHIAAGILILIGCCLCFWLPYVMDLCKTVNHHCPNCGSFIGAYSGC